MHPFCVEYEISVRSSKGQREGRGLRETVRERGRGRKTKDSKKSAEGACKGSRFAALGYVVTSANA